MSKNGGSSTKVTLFWIVGLVAFVSLMLGGTIFLLGLAKIEGGVLNTLSSICHIFLFVCAGVAGFVWLLNVKWNKTVKVVFMVLFIIFFVLAIVGAVRAF